jgi:hypothetical protein
MNKRFIAMARYTLYQTGDKDGTYAECFGRNADRGREIASAPTIAGLINEVNKMNHDDWWICGPGGKSIAGRRKEYYALPSVVKELNRIARDEGRA